MQSAEHRIPKKSCAPIKDEDTKNYCPFREGKKKCELRNIHIGKN